MFYVVLDSVNDVQTLSQGMEPKLTPEVLERYEAARRRFQGEWVRAGVIRIAHGSRYPDHRAAPAAAVNAPAAQAVLRG